MGDAVRGEEASDGPRTLSVLELAPAAVEPAAEARLEYSPPVSGTASGGDAAAVGLWGGKAGLLGGRACADVAGGDFDAAAPSAAAAAEPSLFPFSCSFGLVDRGVSSEASSRS